MKIICYGDSNTYGYNPHGGPALRHPADGRWVDLLAKSLHAGDSGSLVSGVFNAGQNGREIPDNGWESAEGVAGQLAAATEIGDLIIIMLGSNDVLLLTDFFTLLRNQRVAGTIETFHFSVVGGNKSGIADFSVVYFGKSDLAFGRLPGLIRNNGLSTAICVSNLQLAIIPQGRA